MKKIIPFKKEISFKTNVYEITSISLDHALSLEGHLVKGNLLVSGSYKINDISVNVEEFKYNIPVNIEISDNYILDDVVIDIEDFYYEVVDNNLLSVDIEVSIDNIEEKEEVKNPINLESEIKPVELEINDLDRVDDIIEEKEEKIMEENIIEEKAVENRIDAADVKSLFDNFDDSNETFSTYRICIVKENDTIESIILNYGITREQLVEYNDISDIKIGDKLIIPSNDSK